ncbi:hypothetical protein TUM17563_09120 [Klebsiella oxytoca]|nr:hypothetical protein TUM17563_09120 [Klebsiella oxytoca]GKQ19736.1 hypothetical protein NUBL21980_29530 [Klebsiella michiganensis]
MKKKLSVLFPPATTFSAFFFIRPSCNFTLKPDVPNKKFILMAYAVISEENFILLNLYEIEYFTY